MQKIVNVFNREFQLNDDQSKSFWRVFEHLNVLPYYVNHKVQICK